MAGTERICPNCGATSDFERPLSKCRACRKPLPDFCFACHAALEEKARSCSACGRGHWVSGDQTDLQCTAESRARPILRPHVFMGVKYAPGGPQLRWRCLQELCFSDDDVTDALQHFPERPAVRG